ncbi:bifunctional hydroxymethylpyrimidine kinase/phosphomethylpyrimidine kinase [Marinovum sp. 2_MG-2023]|uniref:bifunctional hydroxymethylpyrimidine kinase/phosphomethylpyrimidine kinase n=1 Tax=unclassified Marinovum TaxID=2647166 RepID=UPI0026E355B4|nr:MULTISPECIES: bifunctional hydroxymethylpyrimidine kinase/phosphomethylpyrimidine kinase [unclassified Marinovum]MDO6731866.1 bifunctional hydroxymethylpyrimidine kinase/phosphomethylpyrimidine kinase [Marinovum sp. 2_MG-2023]MDO6781118.1 bifunctional hydroxymethylpyrimidine kinase/phosphomethylpyrimidine kinase [Marinovum sp. 1_MG-2023]
MIPNILTIAGSDPSGGAGIQADIKAISANGGYAMAVITALTAQNTKGVTAVEMVSGPMIAAQIAALRADIDIHAIKIGMLGDVATIETVANALEGLDVPIVLDPVMVAKGGDRLLAADAVMALRERLLPRASVLTPNLPEAADLLQTTEATTLEEMRDQAFQLRATGCDAVLIKGGHLAGAMATDLLITSLGETALPAERFETSNTHGTGCTLSSALATQIAFAHALPDAARRAKAYITGAIMAAGDLSVGGGHGPVHHFHPQAENQT